jgi:hypothetical protein
VHDYSTLRLTSHEQLNLRSWNILILSALDDTVTLGTGSLLLSHFPDFSLVYGAVTQLRLSKASSSPSEVKHAYIAIRAWLLLIERMISDDKCEDEEEYSNMALRVWSELWPPLEALATQVTKFNDGTPMDRSVSEAFCALIYHDPD